MNRLSGSARLMVGILLGALLTMLFPAGPLHAEESPETQLFIAGFNAYQINEYGVAVAKLSRLLREYPASPLRDMNLYWLALACYYNGNRPEAARTMARFLKDYPDHPLKGTVEKELLMLAADYGRGVASAPAPAAGVTGETGATVPQTAEKPAPALSAPAAAAAGNIPPSALEGYTIQTIIIRRGDTLAKLTKRYDTSISLIRRLNRIKGNLILAGAPLRVPVPRLSQPGTTLPPPPAESRQPPGNAP